MLRMALTGHRPERLNYSHYLETDDWRRMINWIKDKVIDLGVTDAYCGMADGGLSARHDRRGNRISDRCDAAFG